MAARSIGSARIAIKLVSIPVRLYTAASRKRPSFNTLHKCGSRVTQVLRCPVDKTDVTREETVKAFEFQPDRYVQFTDEELASFRASLDPEVIKIDYFASAATISATAVDRTMLLGPDKGALIIYRLLERVLRLQGKVGVGTWGDRGSIIVRVIDGGLALQECYLAGEIRSHADIAELVDTELPTPELDLTHQLVTQHTRDCYVPASRDAWSSLVETAVHAKVEGREVVIPPTPADGQPLTLLEALARSTKAPAKTRGRKAKKAA